MPRTKRPSATRAAAPVLAVVGAHPRLRPFSQSLPMSLLRAREAAMRRFRPSLREFGLTEQQWRVLRALSAFQTIEISDLARETCLLGPSVSRILQYLETRRLIARASHPDDLRRGLISLSCDGVALIERVTPFSETIYADIAKRFGAEKLAQLHALVRDFERALGDDKRDEKSDAAQKSARTRRA